MRSRLFTIACAASLAVGACREDPSIDTVAAGTARLTAANSAVLAGLILSDTACGFASSGVLRGGVVNGRPGERGAVTYAVNACTLDYREQPKVLTACDGSSTEVRGLAVLTATLSVSGIVSGDLRNPIFPTEPGAMTLHVSQAALDELAVARAGSPDSLTIREGSLAFTATPLLAASASSGLCTVPTQDVALRDIRYDRASLFVDSTDGAAYLFADTSDIDAQIGQGPLGENVIGGSLNLVGIDVAVPQQALQSDYDRQKFVAGFSCTSDLKLPPSYACASGGASGDQAAAAVSSLTMQSLGAIAALLASDTRCGFASPNSRASVDADAPPGTMGQVRQSVIGCTLDIPTATTAFSDCNGNRVTASGRVTVDAVQTTSGLITGDPLAPVLPGSDDAASIRFTTIRPDGFTITLESSSSTMTASFSMLSGELSAQMVPRLAASRSTGLCTVRTPSTRFEQVAYSAARVLISGAEGTGAVTVDSSNLQATAGTLGAQTNRMSGTITLSGAAFSVDGPLDPTFDPAAFERSFACTRDLLTPPVYACDPAPRLADSAARFTPQIMGGLVALVEADTSCGFSSSRQTLTTTAAPGREGDVTFTLTAPCRIRLPGLTVTGRDCRGVETLASGEAVVTGTKRVHGFFTGNASNPVVPTSRDAVTYDLAADLRGFTVTTSSQTAHLTVDSGRLAGRVQPRAALDLASGACILPTPTAEMSRIRYEDALLRLDSGGATIAIHVAGSDLHAVAGIKGTQNELSGTMTLEGSPIRVPSDGRGLDPSFDPNAFRASFECTPNLVIPSDDAMCSFRGAIGLNVARLAIRSVATALGVVARDSMCGFSAPAVIGAPIQVTGAAGQPGSVTTAITGCTVDRSGAAAMVPLAEDCLRNREFLGGRFTATGTQAIAGMRVDQGPLRGVVPVTYQPANTHLSITFAGLDSYSLGPLAETPAARIRLASGSAKVDARVVLGEDASRPGVFTIPTPLGEFSHLRLTSVPVEVELAGMHFAVTVDRSDLFGFAGRLQGRGNEIHGSITVDGQPFAIAPGTPLDPDFDQERFDLSYDCTPNLASTLPP